MRIDMFVTILALLKKKPIIPSRKSMSERNNANAR